MTAPRFRVLLPLIFCPLMFSTSGVSAAQQDNNVEWDGIFSDTTASFVGPVEVTAGQNLTLRIRVRANDLTSANCRVYQSGLNSTQTLAMTRTTPGSMYDTWSVTFPVNSSSTAIYYRFQLLDGTAVAWYDAGDPSDSWPIRGLTATGRDFRDFLIVPGFATPEWSKQAVFYQIFPDRFSDGDSGDNRLNPDDCFWYLDYAPACRDAASCPDYAQACGSYQVPATPSGYSKFCEVHEDWSESSNGGPCDFFGGDLKGIQDRLGYIQDLQVTALYLNPVFRSMSNHKYDTMDYDTVDPRFGGTAALENLVAGTRERGLQVIADGVFNHASDIGREYNGWMNYAYDNNSTQASGLDAYAETCGAWEQLFLNQNASNWTDCTSDWAQWFKIWVGTDTYDVDRDGNTSEAAAHTCGWYGFEFMPVFDFKSPSNVNSGPRVWLYGGSSAGSLAAARQSIAGRWLADGAQLPQGLDGWRLDVPDNAGYFNNSSPADCSRTSNDVTLWQGFRTATRTVSPNKLVIGEIWSDASTAGGINWFTSKTFDGVMNYHFFGMPLSCFVTGTGVHNDSSECSTTYGQMTYSSATSVDALDAHLATQRRVYPSSAVFSSQNLLSSHDTSRFLSRADGDYQRMKEAIVFQATLPGAPMVYYGDEVGVLGENNEQGRAPFPWEVLEDPSSEASQLRNFTRSLMCVRRSIPALQKGSMLTLWTHNDHKTYGYGRMDSTDRVAVAINNSTSTRTLSLQVYRLDIPDGSLLVDILSGSVAEVSDGVVTITLGAQGASILMPLGTESTARSCVVDVNDPPIANAGPDESICPDETTRLSGEASSDPENSPLTYAWYDDGGQLIASTAVVEVGGLPSGTYTYTLEVSDGPNSDTDSVVLTVKTEDDCSSPSGCGNQNSPVRRLGAGISFLGVAFWIRARRRNTRPSLVGSLKDGSHS